MSNATDWLMSVCGYTTDPEVRKNRTTESDFQESWTPSSSDVQRKPQPRTNSSSIYGRIADQHGRMRSAGKMGALDTGSRPHRPRSASEACASATVREFPIRKKIKEAEEAIRSGVNVKDLTPLEKFNLRYKTTRNDRLLTTTQIKAMTTEKLYELLTTTYHGKHDGKPLREEFVDRVRRVAKKQLGESVKISFETAKKYYEGYMMP